MRGMLIHIDPPRISGSLTLKVCKRKTIKVSRGISSALMRNADGNSVKNIDNSLSFFELRQGLEIIEKLSPTTVRIFYTSRDSYSTLDTLAHSQTGNAAAS